MGYNCIILLTKGYQGSGYSLLSTAQKKADFTGMVHFYKDKEENKWKFLNDSEYV